MNLPHDLDCLEFCLRRFFSQTADASPSTPDPKSQGDVRFNANLANTLESPQKRLLSELLDASKYLEQLNHRLDADAQEASDL